MKTKEIPEDKVLKILDRQTTTHKLEGGKIYIYIHNKNSLVIEASVGATRVQTASAPFVTTPNKKPNGCGWMTNETRSRVTS